MNASGGSQKWPADMALFADLAERATSFAFCLPGLENEMTLHSRFLDVENEPGRDP